MLVAGCITRTEYPTTWIAINATAGHTGKEFIMTSREFCYWLQGFFELNPSTKTLDEKQTALIKRHLGMVFKHEIDPSYPNQSELNQLHGGGAGGMKLRC
jgi:hypothetical protein